MGSAVWEVKNEQPKLRIARHSRTGAELPRTCWGLWDTVAQIIFGISTTRELVAPYLFYRPVTALLIIYLWNCFPWPLRS